MATTVTAPVKEVIYPETDGKPMAETDVHRKEMIALIETLADHFREAPDIYVSGNLLLYYEEGNPSASIAPDVFVVKGVSKEDRRIYKLWEEGKAPNVVIEVTSRGTRLEDQGTKRALYAWLGVKEYFLYDPLGEYLDPPLQGYRLGEREYDWIQPTGEGALYSEELELELRLEDGRLRLVDPGTGERLLTPAEAQEARRAAEARAAQAEAELERLRAELARLRGEGQ